MATFNVRNAAELEEALSNAKGGDEIRLASGDYGELSLKNMQFSSKVTITSADPDAMASFSKFHVDNASNITFDSILFDYEYSKGDGHSVKKFRVEDSSNIAFTNSIFDGDFASGTGTTADGTGFGRGLSLKNSTNIDVTNTEFHSWWKAISVTSSSDVNLTGNNIHTIRSDGLTIGRSHNVLLENNYIHDFGGAAGSGDHRDMIQIMRSSQDGSSNITIRNNVFDIGSGDYTQTIFAGTDKANAGDPTDWHRDIVIEGNLIYNAHTHGISLSLTDGLTITNNTLIAVPREKTGGITIPKIIVSSDSKNVTIEQNITHNAVGYEGQSDWSVKNNAYIQNSDPSDPGYYDTQFIYYATTQKDGYNQFGIKDGSTADNLNAGSDLADDFPFSYKDWVGSSSSDVSNSGGDGSSDSGSSDQDGSDTGSGGQDNSDDSGSGNQGGSDTGSGGQDNTDSGSGGQGGSGSQSHMTFDDFVLDIANLANNGQADLKGDASIVDTDAGPAISFDGDGDIAKIGRLTEFEQSEQLAFMVEFARDEADGSSQRLVWNKGHVNLTLKGDGLIAHVADADGNPTRFTVDDIGLNDTDTHKIVLMVDQNADRLQVLVDDVVVLDETDTDFDFVEGSHGGRQWGWNLGTKSRDVNGEITAFAIDDEVEFVDTQAFQTDDMFA